MHELLLLLLLLACCIRKTRFGAVELDAAAAESICAMRAVSSAGCCAGGRGRSV